MRIARSKDLLVPETLPLHHESLSGSHAAVAFRKEMTGRQYGHEEWIDAWTWFESGYRARDEA